jgi:hypothetical protein
MAKFWKEPLDASRHRDHFRAGAASLRKPLPLGSASSYFVGVGGFTFEFASLAQIEECLAFFETRIHKSSRAQVFEPEKGEWQAWHERLPAHILKGSKRARVTKALRDALSSFSRPAR